MNTNAYSEKLPIGHNDPILQELWTVKAKINQEAKFNIAELLANLNKSVELKTDPY